VRNNTLVNHIIEKQLQFYMRQIVVAIRRAEVYWLDDMCEWSAERINQSSPLTNLLLLRS